MCHNGLAHVSLSLCGAERVCMCSQECVITTVQTYRLNVSPRVIDPFFSILPPTPSRETLGNPTCPIWEAGKLWILHSPLLFSERGSQVPRLNPDSLVVHRVCMGTS